MKITAKTISMSLALISLLIIGGFPTSASTQQRLPPCWATADQIYYVASGQTVTEVHPGSNGGNGYQINILGSNPGKFKLVKEPYMASVALVSSSDSQAKWQVFFNPKMGQVLKQVRMMSACTGRAVHDYPLIESVTLLDQ
jgi:hypothetical protein